MTGFASRYRGINATLGMMGEFRFSGTFLILMDSNHLIYKDFSGAFGVRQA